MHRRVENPGPRVLIILHGLGEHGGRYFHFPHYLQDAVDAVYCLDHRGHGRSEGLRGHVDRFHVLAEDSAIAIERLDRKLREQFGRSEIHLLGHSTGALIALLAIFSRQDASQGAGENGAKKLPLYSVTLSAPLLGIAVKVPFLKRMAAHCLSSLWGSVHMTSEVDPALLSRDESVAVAYRQDRLVHKKVTPRFYVELLAALTEVNRRDSGLDYPIQFLIPMQDRITDPDASLRFFRNLKHREKQLKTYSHFYHEPFNELEKEQAFDDLKQWIVSHPAPAINVTK